jgi:hypothetical protein
MLDSPHGTAVSVRCRDVGACCTTLCHLVPSGVVGSLASEHATSTPWSYVDRARSQEPSLEVGEVGADGRDRSFVVLGVVDAEAGEDIEGVLPVGAGLLGLVQCVVGVGESAVGAGLVVELVQFGRELEGPVVVGEGGIGMAGCVVYLAEAEPCFELRITGTSFVREVEQPLQVVFGLLVPALQPMDVAEAGQRLQLGVALAGGAGKAQRLLVGVADQLVPALRDECGQVLLARQVGPLDGRSREPAAEPARGCASSSCWRCRPASSRVASSNAATAYTSMSGPGCRPSIR